MTQNLNIRQVEVFLNNMRVGMLALTSKGIAAFEYDAEFLQDGFSISPIYLPLKPGVVLSRREPFSGLHGVFNDSLPDGWGMLLTDRLLRQYKISLSNVNVLDRLSLTGDNGMGALTYRPAWNMKDQSIEREDDFHRIAGDVEKILHETYEGDIEKYFQQGGSSGGARPKVLLSIDNEEWLVKFRSSSDPENIGEIEYAWSLAAKASGIEMTETRLFDGKYFGTRRFDRVGALRYHVLSASGLLHASHRYPSLDYIDLIKATVAVTKDMEEAYKLYRIMVFNVMNGNRDDHAKNFSFLYRDGSWKFTPAYDLVRSSGFNGQHTTTIAGSGLPGTEDILEVAKQTGLSLKRANQIIDEVTTGSRSIRSRI